MNNVFALNTYITIVPSVKMRRNDKNKQDDIIFGHGLADMCRYKCALFTELLPVAYILIVFSHENVQFNIA